MSGFGTMPAGLGPFGLGTPLTTTVPGGRVYEDSRGVQQSARYLDAVTGDVSFNAYGRSLGMAGLRQQVQLRLSTKAFTSAMRPLGHRLGEIQRISDNFSKVVDTEVRATLSDLVEAGLIEVNAVTITRIPKTQGATFVHVQWTDLSTQESFDESVNGPY